MILRRTSPPGKVGWPTRPGPQPHNRIGSLVEQLHRVHQPPRQAKSRCRGTRRVEILEERLREAERLLGLVMLRQRVAA